MNVLSGICVHGCRRAEGTELTPPIPVNNTKAVALRSVSEIALACRVGEEKVSILSGPKEIDLPSIISIGTEDAGFVWNRLFQPFLKNFEALGGQAIFDVAVDGAYRESGLAARRFTDAGLDRNLCEAYLAAFHDEIKRHVDVEVSP